MPGLRFKFVAFTFVCELPELNRENGFLSNAPFLRIIPANMPRKIRRNNCMYLGHGEGTLRWCGLWLFYKSWLAFNLDGFGWAFQPWRFRLFSLCEKGLDFYHRHGLIFLCEYCLDFHHRRNLRARACLFTGQHPKWNPDLLIFYSFEVVGDRGDNVSMLQEGFYMNVHHISMAIWQWKRPQPMDRLEQDVGIRGKKEPRKRQRGG